MHPPFILPSLGLIQSKCTLGEHKCIGVDSKSHCIPGFVLLYPAVFRVWGKEYQWGRLETWYKHTLSMYQCILSEILTPPALPGLRRGDLKGRRRGGGAHGHISTSRTDIALISFAPCRYIQTCWGSSIIAFITPLITPWSAWPQFLISPTDQYQGAVW